MTLFWSFENEAPDPPQDCQGFFNNALQAIANHSSATLETFSFSFFFFFDSVHRFIDALKNILLLFDADIGSDAGAKWTMFHGQRKWALFRRSKPSKKKMIASLIGKFVRKSMCFKDCKLWSFLLKHRFGFILRFPSLHACYNSQML